MSSRTDGLTPLAPPKVARTFALPACKPEGAGRARRVRRWGMLVGLALSAAACGGPQDSVTPTVATSEMTAQQIDQDPLALLPGGMVGFARLEARPTFAASFGPSLAQLLRQLAPLPSTAGFVVERDLERLYLGLYSIAGADMAGVAVGRFDENLIRAAAQSVVSGQTRPVGVLVQSLYAGKTVYTVNNLGFCLLTAQTALFGNETGIRRALDRIREGRAHNRMPSWTKDLLDAQKAPIGFGVDLRATAMSDSLSKQVPFVEGLVAARVLGNYAAPGLNLAGTLGYPTPEAAVIGAQRFNQTRDLLAQSGFLLTLFNIAQPIEKLEAKANGTEADFIASANGATLGRFITQMTPTVVAATKAGLLQGAAR